MEARPFLSRSAERQVAGNFDLLTTNCPNHAAAVIDGLASVLRRSLNARSGDADQAAMN